MTHEFLILGQNLWSATFLLTYNQRLSQSIRYILFFYSLNTYVCIYIFVVKQIPRKHLLRLLSRLIHVLRWTLDLSRKGVFCFILLMRQATSIKLAKRSDLSWWTSLVWISHLGRRKIALMESAWKTPWTRWQLPSWKKVYVRGTLVEIFEPWEPRNSSRFLIREIPLFDPTSNTEYCFDVVNQVLWNRNHPKCWIELQFECIPPGVHMVLQGTPYNNRISIAHSPRYRLLCAWTNISLPQESLKL